MGTHVESLPLDLSQIRGQALTTAIDERVKRGREIVDLGEDAGTKDIAELNRINDELQQLKNASTIQPHPGFPKPRARPTEWKVESTQFGRLDGLGEMFLSELRKQGGGELKALDATSGGATMPASFFDPRLRDMPSRQLFVRSLIPSINVPAGDKVDYVRQTVATYGAEPVAAGSVKPSTLISAERVSAPVRVIATVSEAMDRSLLSDYDRLVDFINGQLRISVLQAEENEIVSGSGSGVHLTGILNSGIQTQAKGSDPTPDAVLKGMTKIRSYYYEPDAVVFHPNDWQEIATLRTADGIYIWRSPSSEADPRIWGKRIIQSPAVSEGTALVGSFGEGATVYEREGVRISFAETGANDGSSDLFLTNQVRWRAESRIALAVHAPVAFTKVTGI